MSVENEGQKPCAVPWCVACGSPYCAVHTVRGKDYQPEDIAGDARGTLACETCEGSGDCQDCDGEGMHECDHRNCWEEHECSTCRGTGECRDCQTPKGQERTFEERYLAFAFDPGWRPTTIIAWPWDTETAA